MSSTGKRRNRWWHWLVHGRPAMWHEEKSSGLRGAGVAGQAEAVRGAAALALNAWSGEAVQGGIPSGGQAHRKEKQRWRGGRRGVQKGGGASE